LASRFESGSSNRNSRASRTIARPIATRCRWPPESWRGRRASKGAMSSIAAACCTRRSISAWANLRARSPNAMFS
jgi:hypothetical protein